jgi:hypothetical protein
VCNFRLHRLRAICCGLYHGGIQDSVARVGKHRIPHRCRFWYVRDRFQDRPSEPWLASLISLINVYRHCARSDRCLARLKNAISGFGHFRLQEFFSTLLTHAYGNIFKNTPLILPPQFTGQILLFYLAPTIKTLAICSAHELCTSLVLFPPACMLTSYWWPSPRGRGSGCSRPGRGAQPLRRAHVTAPGRRRGQGSAPASTGRHPETSPGAGRSAGSLHGVLPGSGAPPACETPRS